MKKMTNLIQIFFLSIFVIFSPVILGEEISTKADDQAIQAIASLLFHINEELLLQEHHDLENSSPTPRIAFEEKDIQYLWSQALLLDPSLSEVCEKYWLWRYNRSDKATLDLQQCADHLRLTWHSATNHTPTTQEESPLCFHQYGQQNLNHNPLLNSKIKKEITPFLLPSKLAITPAVNQIFSTSRPTLNSSTLLQAGFQILYAQPRSYIIVASHPAITGFLFKIYYDTELRLKKNVPGWKWFVRRCQGAESIRNVITKKRIKYFTVPNKFIYVLPTSTIPPKMPGIDPKLAVLIVQEMKLVSKELNYLAWKTLITPEILDELYIIISRSNGSSYRPDNIPFTESGTFSFIDTEYPHQNPDFDSIRPFLSEDMLNYWSQLVIQGGP